MSHYFAVSLTHAALFAGQLNFLYFRITVKPAASEENNTSFF
jgi:hypothetical protein